MLANNQKSNQKLRLWKSVATVLIPVIAIAFVSAKMNVAATGVARMDDLNTEKVQKRRFLKTVRVFGEVRSYEPAIVFNDCRYHPRRIVELVSEGSWVEKGDVLCMLDTSELKDRLNEQSIQLIKAKAGLATAEARDSIQQLDNSRRFSKCEMTATLANANLAEYELARAANTRQELSGQKLLKNEILDMSREEYAKTEQMTAIGYNNTAQFEIMKMRLNSAQVDYDRAKGELRLTELYRHPRELYDLQSQDEIAQQEVQRARLQNELATANSRIKRLEMQQWIAGVQNHVDYLTRAIAACTITSPKSGELIYCHKRDEGKYIEVGNTVHYTQDLVRIADRSRMILAGRVRDTSVYELRAGLPTVINVLNVTTREYSGTLQWIASIPSPASWFLPEDLYHSVQIELTNDAESLGLIALGTTAIAEVIVDDRFDVLQVPTRAIFSDEAGYIVIVQTAAGLERRIVQLGQSNDIDVEVLSGLSPDENVVLESPHVLRKLALKLVRPVVGEPSGRASGEVAS